MGTERVVHPLEPICGSDARVLLLGSLPSPKSRAFGMYYANPQNRFWPVMGRLWDEDVPTTREERIAFCHRHRLALWDVIQSCTIEGASDASIADAVPNDISILLAEAPISHIFATGSTAARLYRRLCEPSCGMSAQALPSTSPANARWRLDALVEAYRAVREAADSDKAR